MVDTEGKSFQTHIKSGKLYQIVCYALLEATGEEVVVYEGIETGSVWVRPLSEFKEKFVEVEKKICLSTKI